MKIITKRSQKDYYDFLIGVYGEDPLIVLDRTKNDKLPYSISNDVVVRFYIGGYLVEGYKINDSYYYGENLHEFGDDKRYISPYSYRNQNIEVKDLIYLKDSKSRSPYVLIKPVVDVELINEKENCSILLAFNGAGGVNYLKYPNLSSFNIQSLLSPEVVYKMISDWISSQITKSENKVDSRSNIEKIESKGFDKKTSFRKLP